MSRREQEQKYLEHSNAMGRCMREAREHIDAGASLDLSEYELVKYIQNIRVMLSEASYHAEQMKALRKLLGPKMSESEARALYGDR